MRNHTLSRPLRAAVVAALVVAGLALPLPAAAESYDDKHDAHPLKLAYLFVYPVGKFLELTVTRPLTAAGKYVAPYHQIGEPTSRLCARERSARMCTSVAR